jgi:hypothetical protein
MLLNASEYSFRNDTCAAFRSKGSLSLVSQRRAGTKDEQEIGTFMSGAPLTRIRGRGRDDEDEAPHEHLQPATRVQF